MTLTLLERLSREVSEQPKLLRDFSKSRIAKAPKGSLFVGAGDSYAAALGAFYLSRGTSLALDPYALIASPEMAAGREVFFVSISGRTSANIEAARRVRGVARRTTALTVDETSPLAASTDRTMKLPITVAPRSPGLLSFTLSLLATVMIATGEGSPIDLGRAFRKAAGDSEKVRFASGTTYFLGNSAGYAAAVYSTAKVHELFGSSSQAEMLEEFSHMELFSLRKSDCVNIFSCFDPLGKGRKLHKALLDRRYESSLIPSYGSSAVEQLFHSAFVAQLAVLRKAEAVRLRRPSFQTKRDGLEISDEMIY